MTFTRATTFSACIRACVLAIALGGAFSLFLGVMPATAYADTPTASVTATVTATTTLTATSTFSIPMDTAIVPTIAFSPDISADIATTSTVWTDNMTFVATYAINSGVKQNGIIATVAGAQDPEADLMDPTDSNAFSYDTITWNITATAGANGSIAPSGATAVADGEDQSFTFTPDASYHVAGITIDNGTEIPTATTTYAFHSVAGNHSIAVSFAPYGNVTSVPVLVNLSTANILTVTSVFSQEMSSTTLGVDLGINGVSRPGGEFVPLSAGWSNGTTTYTATFSAAAGLTLSNVVATISGATDSLGNPTGTLTSNAFAVDTVVPVGTITAPTSIVNVASSTVMIATDFTKPMASTTLTTQFLSATSSDITSSFTLSSEGWVTTTRYVAVYDAHLGLNQSGITAITSGASDTNSNAAAAATSSPFTVDTIAPNGTAATGSSIVNVANNTVTITTSFDKSMASSTLAVSFSSGGADVSGDFASTTASWTDDHTYQEIFTAGEDIYQTNIIASVSGAADTDGNAAAVSTTSPFILDTVVPTGSASSPVAASIVNVTNNTVTITTDFSKTMASSTLAVVFQNATSSVDLTSDFSFVSDAWSSATSTYTAIYHAQIGIDEPAVIALVSGAADTDGNSAATTTTSSFTVDTVAPNGTIATPAAAAVFNLASNSITVTTIFDKPMASTTLAINFTPDSISPFISTTTAAWSDASTTYTAVFAVAPGFNDSNVAATISGATDADGNSAPATTTPAFTVDTLAPTGSLSSPTSFTVVNIATSTVSITANFSKPMASSTLAISFTSATSSDISPQFTPTSNGWTSTSSYTAIFSAAAGLFESGVTATVSGATDTHGNSAADATSSPFTVDTLAPTAAVVGSAPLVNVANNTLTITTTFSKEMDATQAPLITFAAGGNDVSTYFTATGTPLTARWSNGTTTYTLLYTIAAPFATTSAVATVQNARDVDQNIAAPSSSTAFAVDTVAPNGSVTSPAAAAVFNSVSNTITFVALFDKAMASTTPTITFAPASIYVYTATSSEGWLNDTTYQAIYSVEPNFNSSAVTIGISGAEDTDQNIAPATSTDAFTVDTLVPHASVISPTASAIVNVANNTITVSALFDKAMASTSPTIVFTSATSSDISAQFSPISASWTSPSAYSATFSAATGLFETGVTATISGAADPDGNPAAATTTPAFTLDTLAPTGSASSPVAASIVNVANNTVTITTDFSKTMASSTLAIAFQNATSSADLSSFFTPLSIVWSNATSTYTAIYQAQAGIDEPAVIALVSGAADTDGNSAATTTTSSFTVDTLAPNGSISGPTGATVVNVSGNTFTVTVNFDKAMATSTMPVIIFTPDLSAVASTTSALWTSATVFTASYSVNVATTTNAIAAISGAVDTDGNLAATTTSPQFTIDTVVPSAAAAVGSSTVNVLNNTITITTNFSKTMASSTLAIAFQNATSSADLSSFFTPLSTVWSNATSTYTAVYQAQAGISEPSVVALISGAVDLDGNAASATTTSAFVVDTLAPTGSVSLPIVSTVFNLASSTIAVTAVFDKPMASTTLAITFAPGSISPFISTTTAAWSNASTTYTAVFAIAPGFNDSNVAATVSGATDQDGNAAASATSSPFTVDTVAPNGTAATGSSIVNVANNTVTITTSFDKSMASSTLAISFASGASDVSGDFASTTASWTDDHTYQEIFTAGEDIYQTNIVASVSGATDTDGNAAAVSTTSPFTLDTIAPVGTVINPTALASITIASTTITVQIDFSKAMDTSVIPNIVFAPDLASLGLATTSSGWASTTEYAVVYDFTGQLDNDAVTVTISGAVDTDGNAAAAISSPAFSIDTVPAPAPSPSVPTGSIVMFGIGGGAPNPLPGEGGTGSSPIAIVTPTTPSPESPVVTNAVNENTPSASANTSTGGAPSAGGSAATTQIPVTIPVLENQLPILNTSAPSVGVAQGSAAAAVFKNIAVQVAHFFNAIFHFFHLFGF